MTPRYRLSWLHNAPSPNQMEFFHELGKAPGVRLRVYHCSSRFDTRPFSLGEPWLQDAALSFDHHVLPGVNPKISRNRDLYVNPGILGAIARSSPEEIWLVGGYTIPTTQLAMWALHFRKLRWILVCEPPKVYSPLRDLVRKQLLLPFRLGARGVVVYGCHRAARYFHGFVPEDRVRATPQYQNLSPLLSIRSNHHSELGNQPLRFFYAGQLEPYSGVDLLVRCFTRLARLHADVELSILGSGSQRRNLESLIPEPVKSRVRFHGAVSRQQVPEIFAAGDVFVQANHGQGWGMAVNEALAAAMPVISSRAVGSAEELVVDGVNGFLLDNPRDEDGFFRRMEFFALSRHLLPEFSRRARETAARLELQKGVAEFVCILDHFLRFPSG